MNGARHDEFNEMLGGSVRGHLAEIPDQEDDTLTLAEMDGKTLRPTNKPCPRLHVVKKDGTVNSFQYIYLDAKSVFMGNRFIFVFAGAKHWEVSVEGRGKRFWAVYDYVSLHRWAYLREAVRDMGQEEDIVITKIEITDVTPHQ